MSSAAEAYLRRMQSGGSRSNERLKLALRYIAMLLIAAIMVGPFLWLFYLSVRTEGGIFTWPSALSDFSMKSYVVVMREYTMGRAFLNSSIAAALQVTLTVLVASLAAFPLARYDFYGKNIVFIAILSTLMVPFQLYMIPLFLLTAKTLGMGNSLWGLVLPTCASVFGIYLVRQHYTTIPRDLDEAARIDGASEFRLWWQIMFPLTKPAIATLGIYTFVASWSNFLWPLILLQDENKQTLPLLIATLFGTFSDSMSYLAAGSVMAIAPVIIFFLLLQRYFLAGVTVGAVKG